MSVSSRHEQALLWGLTQTPAAPLFFSPHSTAAAQRINVLRGRCLGSQKTVASQKHSRIHETRQSRETERYSQQQPDMRNGSCPSEKTQYDTGQTIPGEMTNTSSPRYKRTNTRAAKHSRIIAKANTEYTRHGYRGSRTLFASGAAIAFIPP